MKNISKYMAFFALLLLLGCQQVVNDSDSPENQDPDRGKKEVAESSLLSPENVLNIAHRGASGHAPEHTMPSYELAEEMHGDYLEIDLQMTKDGELIAMHDSEVDRTTDSQGDVIELSLSDITGLGAGEWFNEDHPELAQSVFIEAKVPSLKEIFERFGKDVNYYIETKQPDISPGMAKELISVLDDYGMLDETIREGQIIIQSFSEESLVEMKELEPELPLIQLISYQKKASISERELEHIASYAVGIGVNYKFISEEYVGDVRDAGLLIHPYTVNKKKDMEQMIDWGVTGMFTNYPDRLTEVIAAYDN